MRLFIILYSFVFLKVTICYEFEITGNLTFFDSIFSSRTPTLIVDADEINLSWTEGPVVYEQPENNKRLLLFSDTIIANIYSYDFDQKETTILFENSGDAPVEDLSWRAEPGSNGLVLFGIEKMNKQFIFVCQHGGQQMSVIDLSTGERFPLVIHASNGKKLNGPNDVIVKEEFDGIYIYFTDPVFAWFERDRFQDLPYLDERVKKDGPGFCGIYRSRLNILSIKDKLKIVAHKVELIATMDRPNGIAFLKGDSSDKLVVSDCCTGTHKLNCQQGTSRWNIFQQRNKMSNEWDLINMVEDVVPPNLSIGGCADGFKAWVGPNGEDVLIASCSDGLCLVNMKDGKVEARILTTSPKSSHDNDGGCRISNVAIYNNKVFLTGNCGIFQMNLKKHKDTKTDLSSSEL
mmetsp:Transcript_3469/g.3985  ORF Transcript_3469/g.3985 Transcript_3469/m.3985 type:complete len:404 (+) Transcript_3469:43-1254(+)